MSYPPIGEFRNNEDPLLAQLRRTVLPPLDSVGTKRLNVQSKSNVFYEHEPEHHEPKNLRLEHSAHSDSGLSRTTSPSSTIYESEHCDELPKTCDSGFYEYVETPSLPPAPLRGAKRSRSWECDADDDDAPGTPRAKRLRMQDHGVHPSPVPNIQHSTPVDSELFESPKEEFLDKVFEESGRFTSCSPTISTDSQGGSNSSQQKTTPPSSLPSTTYASQGTGASNKRRRRNDDEEEWNGPNRPWKQQRPGPSDMTEPRGLQGRRLACPFYLFDGQKFCKDNSTGNKKYETCSGPGWPSMHHLKQHLGNSAGSVHKKIRCPRCLNSFKSASAVLKHQKAHPSQCLNSSDSSLNQDDINESTWDQIDDEITRQGFNRLRRDEQEGINLWVLRNLNETQNQPVEDRKWELRKWNMTWRILFPGRETPSSPFYDDDVFMSLTNTELLIKSFKETVESRIEFGDIEGIGDETLDKLLESLRVAISCASSSNQQQRDLLRRRLLNPALEQTVSKLPEASHPGASSGESAQEKPALQQNILPITIRHSSLTEQEQGQFEELRNPTSTTSAVQFTAQQYPQPGPSGDNLTHPPFWPGLDFNIEDLDQFPLEWNPEWDQPFQNPSDPPSNSAGSELPSHLPAREMWPDVDFGKRLY